MTNAIYWSIKTATQVILSQYLASIANCEKLIIGHEDDFGKVDQGHGGYL